LRWIELVFKSAAYASANIYKGLPKGSPFLFWGVGYRPYTSFNTATCRNFYLKAHCQPNAISAGIIAKHVAGD
jgi:hypothetical protein